MNGFSLNLSDKDFHALAALVHRKAGINLHEGKKELVRARLAGRIREGRFPDFGSYYDYIVRDKTGDELVYMLDAISTNLTRFFREPRHFEFMAQIFLPELAGTRKKKGGRRLRVWSAGCSTGEEPYSIAMTVVDHSPFFAEGNFKVLATDLSTRALSEAVQGVYRADRVNDVPMAVLRKHFRKGRGHWAGWYRVKPEVRSLCVFRRLNFMDPFPFRKSFDMVFCRNVMIYFDKKIQFELVQRFHEVLVDGGYLCIGHSESLSGIDHNFKYVQPTIYRK